MRTKRFLIRTAAQFQQAVVGLSGILQDGVGAFVVITGDPGKGKTTLLRCAFDCAQVPFLPAAGCSIRDLRAAAFSGALCLDYPTYKQWRQVMALTRGVLPAGMYRRTFGIFVCTSEASADMLRTATHHFEIKGGAL